LNVKETAFSVSYEMVLGKKINGVVNSREWNTKVNKILNNTYVNPWHEVLNF